MDADTAHAVCTLRPASGDAAYVITYDDPRGAGEANIREARRHGPRPPADRVPSRACSGAPRQQRRAVASTADVIVDIEADVIPSCSGHSIGRRAHAARQAPGCDPDRAGTTRRRAGVRGRGRRPGCRPPPGSRAPARGRRRHGVRGSRRSARGSSPRRRSTATARPRTSSCGGWRSGRRRCETIDRVAAFSEVGRRRVRAGEVLVARGSAPAFVYVPMADGLVVRPIGGYAPSPLPAWVPGRDDGRHPPGGAQQRHRRRRRTWRSSSSRARSTPARGSGRSPPASSSPGCGPRSAHDAVHDRAGRRAPPGRGCSRTSRAGRSRRSRSGRARSRLGAGAIVIEEGAVEDHLYAIVHGSLRVHRGDETLAILGPGATVGELAALVPEPRAASVTALEPTVLLRIDKPLLDELLADRPALANGIIAALVAMVRERAGRARSRPRERTDRPDRHVTLAPLPPRPARRGGRRPVAHRAGAAVRGDGGAAGRRRQRDVPRRVRRRVAARDVHRDRHRRDRRLGRRRPDGAAVRPRRARRRRARRRRRRDRPRLGRRARRVRGLGLDPAPRAVPHPHPARLRVPRRAGRAGSSTSPASRRASRGS